jgi:hypothetical protein
VFSSAICGLTPRTLYATRTGALCSLRLLHDARRGSWRRLRSHRLSARGFQLLQPVREVRVCCGKPRDYVLVPLGLDAPTVQLALEEANSIAQFLYQSFMVFPLSCPAYSDIYSPTSVLPSRS